MELNHISIWIYGHTLKNLISMQAIIYNKYAIMYCSGTSCAPEKKNTLNDGLLAYAKRQNKENKVNENV